MVSHLGGISQNGEVQERSAKYYGIRVFETKTKDGNWSSEKRVKLGASYRRSEGFTEVLLKNRIFWHVTPLSTGKSSSYIIRLPLKSTYIQFIKQFTIKHTVTSTQIIRHALQVSYPFDVNKWTTRPTGNVQFGTVWDSPSIAVCKLMASCWEVNSSVPKKHTAAKRGYGTVQRWLSSKVW